MQTLKKTSEESTMGAQRNAKCLGEVHCTEVHCYQITDILEYRTVTNI